LGAICLHPEAVTFRDITRLLISGTCRSLRGELANRGASGGRTIRLHECVGRQFRLVARAEPRRARGFEVVRERDGPER
jgi:hypothetical protein